MNALRPSRRDVIRTLAAAALPAWLGSAGNALSATLSGFCSRRYRIDASILVFGASMIRRAGVGGAYLAKEQRIDADGSSLFLEFAAGSWPERAHGIRRMGLFQEVQEKRVGQPPQAAFFGFMTSSPEKDVREARRSMSAEGDEHYVAVLGSGSQGRFRCRRAEVKALPGQKWEECRRLSGDLRRQLEQSSIPPADVDTGDTQPNTFLDSVRLAMLSSRDSHEASFVHNAVRYRLTARRRIDQAAAARFAAKGLAAPSARVERLTGAITDSAGKSSGFQVWFESGDTTGLPLSFEFQPRSFLRLVFEWERGASAPQPVSALFRKEDA